MGITGLIPFLEKASKRTNISEFSGGTVAIDTYCWLHKGAFSCADKIVMGQPTDLYVKYCMRFVQMLVSHKIKPILVFDGRHLPAKAETEVKRRESRAVNRKRAAEFMKMGKVNEGRNLLRRSLDVSHEMALEVIKECQALNVDCIVAPYEADAQLAYLNLSGIADVVITEDSDLTLFGCKKILFKMDVLGNGLLVEQDRLHLAMGLRPDTFNLDKFIYMCILSGCDYLPSLPGIGLQKACKFIVKNTDNNIYNALTKIASILNKKTLVVTKEYRDGFMRALVTFKHQLVYCPIQRKQVRLNPPTPDVTEEQLIHAGTEVDAELAWQFALGNFEPFSGKKLHDFDPDKTRLTKTNSWSESPMAKRTSIWSKNYSTSIEDKKPAVIVKKTEKLPVKPINTRGRTVTMKTDSLKRDITPKKRTFEEAEMSVDEIVQLYGRQEAEPANEQVKPAVDSSDKQKTPTSSRRPNPFQKLNSSSPTLSNRMKTRRCVAKSWFKATVIDDTVVKQSKFFAENDDEQPAAEAMEVKKEEEKDKSEKDESEPMDITIDSMDVNVDNQDFKENLDCAGDLTVDDVVRQKVIIPETEAFDDDEVASNLQGCANKDSPKGHQESSKEQTSVTEKEPLHSIDNNTVQQVVTESRNELRSKENEDEGVQFSITREIFSEFQSSMFTYESPNKRPRTNSFQNSERNPPKSLQRSSSLLGTRSKVKKPTTIKGQQNISQMFGFQKKNNLQY